MNRWVLQLATRRFELDGDSGVVLLVEHLMVRLIAVVAVLHSPLQSAALHAVQCGRCLSASLAFIVT